MLTKRPKDIFIVEDNEIYSMMLGYILSKDSIYRFLSFKSGEECIKNLNLNPDVIILDYGLPGMNGYDTLREIKKQSPHIHVIMLSSNRDVILAEKLVDAGADDYILKQSNVKDQIIEKIEAVLTRDSLEKIIRLKLKSKSFREKMLFIILTLAILSIGLIYFN